MLYIPIVSIVNNQNTSKLNQFNICGLHLSQCFWKRVRHIFAVPSCRHCRHFQFWHEYLPLYPQQLAFLLSTRKPVTQVSRDGTVSSKAESWKPPASRFCFLAHQFQFKSSKASLSKYVVGHLFCNLSVLTWSLLDSLWKTSNLRSVSSKTESRKPPASQFRSLAHQFQFKSSKAFTSTTKYIFGHLFHESRM